MRLHPGAAAVEVPRALLSGLAPGALDVALRSLGARIGADRDGPWFTRRHLRRISDLLVGEGALDLPRGLRFSARGSRAFLRREAGDVPRHGPPAVPRLERADRSREEFDLPGFLASAGPETAAVDADRLGPDAVVRLADAADRFTPHGAGSGRPVAVLAWLRRRQVPGWLRLRTPVVAGARGIAWIPGFRVDREHLVRPGTRRVAVLRVRWDTPPG